MKKILTVLAIITAFSVPAYSAETGGAVVIGNNNLTAVPMTSAAFPGTEFPWGAELFWKKAANDSSGIEVGFYRNSVLNNLAYTNFYYKEDLFSIEVGPFFGLFNNTKTLIKSGIATNIRVNIPGFAFAEFDTQSTIGGRLVNVGDYIQEANTISAGFYVYNAICTLRVDTQSYVEINAAAKTQTVDFTEYAFIAGLFQKNVPYTAAIKMGFQQRTRTIETVSIESLSGIILGTEFSISPFEFLSLDLGLDSGLYTFGSYNDIAADTTDLLTFADTFPGNFLFNAKVGFTVDLDNINN